MENKPVNDKMQDDPVPITIGDVREKYMGRMNASQLAWLDKHSDSDLVPIIHVEDPR